jgi:hypothetical protein
MRSNHRPSPGSRREALGRLRALTTGVAVTGIAATAGFGFVAAVGNSGTSSQTLASSDQGNGAGSGGGSGGVQQVPIQQPAANPQSGNGLFGSGLFGSGQTQTRGSGRNHATTGGS